MIDNFKIFKLKMEYYLLNLNSHQQHLTIYEKFLQNKFHLLEEKILNRLFCLENNLKTILKNELV